MIGATIKAIKPATLNPGTNKEASQKHSPLMTSENAPKLKMFMGRESKEITGLTPPLISPITTAATKAAGKLAMLTPEKMISTTSKLRVVASIANKEPIIFFSPKFVM